MLTEQGSSYDAVPYEDGCYPGTHPDRLATIAAVYGLPVPPVERCRVLELGCARGGNLLPMALELPDSSFVGVDLSTRQIAEASALAERLGLRNVELRAMSIADVDDGFGEFDFVVCHGVYSWVPEPVRDRILEVCSRNLAPHGLAYVSYNTYPGWSARGMVRDLVRFHTRAETSPEGRLGRTRGFLEQLAAIQPNPKGAYASILRSEGERFRDAAESYLIHEVFEDDNDPCSVHDFLGRAGSFGLEFVAEAQAPGLLLGMPEATQAAVGRWAGDVPAREQYLDFVVNRSFRRSILRRAGGEAPAVPSVAGIENLYVRAAVEPVSKGGRAEAATDAPVEFAHPAGTGTVTTNNPYLKTALLALFEAAPRALGFEALWRRVEEGLAAGGERPPLAGDEGRRAFRESMLRLFLSDLVHLHVRPPRPAVEVSVRPVSSPLARIQAAERDLVTSLLRRPVRLNAIARAVLLQLDGSRTAEDVLEALAGKAASGSLEIDDGTGRIRDETAVREVLAREVGTALRSLARGALLVE